MQASTLIRARAAQRIAAKHYEVGNQSKCYKAVWRRFVFPNMGICYATFLTYLKLKLD
jgi:hypothetical protein